jgi:hypothetical protein
MFWEVCRKRRQRCYCETCRISCRETVRPPFFLYLYTVSCCSRWLIVVKGRIILEERFRRAKQRQLAKRTPQTTAGSLLTLFSAFWSTLQNWDEVRPVSKVPNVQDSMSPYWPGARRTKVRYGPYRVPAISVRCRRLEQTQSELGILTNATGEKP